MPAALNASVTVVSVGAVMSAPAPWASSTARSATRVAPRFGPCHAYSSFMSRPPRHEPTRVLHPRGCETSAGSGGASCVDHPSLEERERALQVVLHGVALRPAVALPRVYVVLDGATRGAHGVDEELGLGRGHDRVGIALEHQQRCRDRRRVV